MRRLRKLRFIETGSAVALLSAAGLSLAQDVAPPVGTNSSASLAQGLVSESPVAGAAGVRLDPFVVYPSITLSQGYNDNVALSSANQVKSAFTALSASLLAELKGARSSYQLSYSGSYGIYESSNADNYDYHTLRGSAAFDFSSRSRFSAFAEYALRSDPRGATLASTGTGAPNKYNETDVGGTFSYGAVGAQGRLEVTALGQHRRYTNNALVTDTLNFDSYKLSGIFFWRVAPKTELLVEADEIRTDYTSPASVQDNTEHRYLAGVKWDATAATTGIFKVGMSDKKYQGIASSNNPRGTVWEGSLVWSPLTYSVIQVTTGKSFLDSQGGPGSFSTTDEFVNFKWTHAWAERFRSEMRGGYARDVYSGINRTDDTSGFGMKFTYDMRRWLGLGAEYTYTERSSTLAGADFKRNVILFSLRATL